VQAVAGTIGNATGIPPTENATEQGLLPPEDQGLLHPPGAPEDNATGQPTGDEQGLLPLEDQGLLPPPGAPEDNATAAQEDLLPPPTDTEQPADEDLLPQEGETGAEVCDDGIITMVMGSLIRLIQNA
jgi:hypothetical protein